MVIISLFGFNVLNIWVLCQYLGSFLQSSILEKEYGLAHLKQIDRGNFEKINEWCTKFLKSSVLKRLTGYIGIIQGNVQIIMDIPGL